MSATPEARTRAFARVIGPFLVIVPGTVAVRAPGMGAILTAFFANDALVWITGARLLFGWFLALPGLALLAAPQLMAGVAHTAITMVPIVEIGFGVFVLIGLRLTYVGWSSRPPVTS